MNNESATLAPKKLPGIDEILETIIKEEGETPIPAPARQTEFTPRVEKDKFCWSHPDFGMITVSVKDHEFTTIEQGDTNLRARLPKGIHPDHVQLWIFGNPNPGVKLLHYQDGAETDATMIPIPGLNVPVKWITEKLENEAEKKEGEGEKKPAEYPHTRERGRDNADIILLRPNGEFFQLQVSVTTRRGTFWVNLQEGYHGQVVCTTAQQCQKLKKTAHNEDGTKTVMPMASEHAYPGTDFLGIHKGMGPQIMKQAVKHCDSLPQASRCRVAKWKPETVALTDEMKARNWKVGHPAYYNLVTGTGVIINDEGKQVFVHFSKVENQDGVPAIYKKEFPVLEPMQAYMFKGRQGPKGLESTAVCSIQK